MTKIKSYHIERSQNVFKNEIPMSSTALTG